LHEKKVEVYGRGREYGVVGNQRRSRLPEVGTYANRLVQKIRIGEYRTRVLTRPDKGGRVTLRPKGADVEKNRRRKKHVPVKGK